MPRVPTEIRDQLAWAFRQRICEKMDERPFEHQAQWWAAAGGYVLTEERAEKDDLALEISLPDKSREWRKLLPRPEGTARVLADLGAFKSGKSWAGGRWAAGFAAVPDARVALVGLEYDICQPEFEYICEALLSDKGMGMKYSSLQNRPRDGRMYLDLPNGARYEARSWERKDSLKGKEHDAYIYCEAYQLPGLECYTGFSQNLQARQGYAVFATTPDRPWVGVFHEHGHGDFPEWYCVCGVPRSVNPHTFSQEAMDRADPQKGGIMTQEKFQIAFLGQLGEFIGRCYNYQRGQFVFTPRTHPHLWLDPGRTASRDNLSLPSGWAIIGGSDTGTYRSAVLVAFSPDGEAFVIDEIPNYRYIAGQIDLNEAQSIPEWARLMEESALRWGGRGIFWADANSQFKRELQNYNITLLGNKQTPETRTEISREYFQAGKIWLAPWLSVLPFELEWAHWPEEATASGKFARVKDRDHTLDCLEHILSRRPRGKELLETPKTTWIQSFLASMPRKRATSDPHLGKK